MASGVLSVNGTNLPYPQYQSYSAIRREIVNADRTIEGDLLLERINTKYTVYAEWKGLTAAQKNLIISATDADGSTQGAFYLGFLSTMNDKYLYGWFYRGDIGEGDLVPYGKFDGSSFQYYDLKLSFIQL